MAQWIIHDLAEKGESREYLPKTYALLVLLFYILLVVAVGVIGYSYWRTHKTAEKIAAETTAQTSLQTALQRELMLTETLRQDKATAAALAEWLEISVYTQKTILETLAPFGEDVFVRRVAWVVSENSPEVQVEMEILGDRTATYRAAISTQDILEEAGFRIISIDPAAKPSGSSLRIRLNSPNPYE